MALIVDEMGSVLLITLNRPEAMNAIDPETQRELHETWIRFNEDEHLRVAVLTGAGERAFCAGADLKKTGSSEVSFAAEFLRLGRRIGITGHMEVPKPIIAAINGYALGGGLELALNCDLRICCEEARFGLPEVKVASIPASGGTQRLVRALPPAIAMKMLLTGELIDAHEAYRVGLVSDLVSREELLPRAIELAEKICANGPLAVKAAKLAALKAGGAADEGLQFEAMLWGLLRDTEDRLEGRQAFREKRKPQYKGR